MAKETTSNKALSLKALTKSSVWDVQENDIFRMLDAAEKDSELKDSLRHYADIIRSAFMIEEVKDDSKPVLEKYTKQGYKVNSIKLGEDQKITWAIKKRPIMRVTDLTYENIRHITAAKLTTTLPKDRLHKKGGMYEKKIADGYEVLEVAKGSWVEAIFAKLKPETIKPRMTFDDAKDLRDGDEEDEEEDLSIDNYNSPDEDDVEIDEPNDDEINENNYRTTFDIASDPDEDAESLSDFIADE